jgi:histidine ammonia-lyase
LAERQLELLLNPDHNSDKPPMLAPHPGSSSGLAGVQIAATSYVAKIRQLAYPAMLTALPTNLGNQDHVPNALNGANTASSIVEYAWLVVGSLGLAVNQWTHLDETEPGLEGMWKGLQDEFPPLEADRPLAEEVRHAAKIMELAASSRLDSKPE